MKKSSITVAVLFILTNSACDFCDRGRAAYCLAGNADEIADELSEVTDRTIEVVFEEAPRIISYHGSGCAQSNLSGMEKVIIVSDSISLPDYVTDATVFLNGWSLEYLGSDHHVHGIGVGLHDIEITISGRRRILRWKAMGVISDQNFDDGYEFCYRFTIVGWNSARFSLQINDDGICGEEGPSNFFESDNSGTTTALSAFHRFMQDERFNSVESIAVLPRGFGFRLPCREDHHLLQLAYRIDHAEKIVNQGTKYESGIVLDAHSRVDSGDITWISEFIAKDNEARRDLDFGELVSLFGGNEMTYLSNPYTILPEEDAAACVPEPYSIRTSNLVFTNIPYEFVIPVLNGWNMYFVCDDEHVKRIGAGITSWSIESSVADQRRTLRCTVETALYDKDESPGHASSVNVSLLQISPIRGGSGVYDPEVVEDDPVILE